MVGRRLIDENDSYLNSPRTREQFVRRAVLRETVQRIEEDGVRLREDASRNLARWRAEAPENVPRVVEVVAGDWGEVAQAATKRYGRCFAVLNMANAWVPGGGYVEGSVAQEENMFRRTDGHYSIDESVYDEPNDQYLPHVTRLLEARDGRVLLDTDSPRICIRGREERERPDLGYRWLDDDEVFPFYELRAAAVDIRWGGAEFDPVEMRRRIRAQLDTLAAHDVRHVVLGAFGCGAFGNPGDRVALIYRDEISKSSADFDVVIFAVFDAGYGPDNFALFQSAFVDRQWKA